MKTEFGSLKYYGVDLDIEFNYTPLTSGNLWSSNGDPGDENEGGEFYLNKVEVNGIDITSILYEDQLEAITDQYKSENGY